MEIADDDSNGEYDDSDDDTAEKSDEDDDDEPFKILCAKEMQLMEKTQPNTGYTVCSNVPRLHVCDVCTMGLTQNVLLVFTIYLRHIDGLTVAQSSVLTYWLIFNEFKIPTDIPIVKYFVGATIPGRNRLLLVSRI